jgi:hypothetical protein
MVMDCIEETDSTLEDFPDDDTADMTREFADLLDIRQPIESKCVRGVLLSDSGITQPCRRVSFTGA